MSSPESNYFRALAGVDCSAHVEHKGRFAYLSWPFAVAELLSRHPEATWTVHETSEGVPYVQSPAGAFVKVTVTVNGIARTQVHPILDGNNRVVAEPDAFAVNTSIQRALVKAIALHGLGLYLHAGEDLPAERSTLRSRPVLPAGPGASWAAQIAACETIAALHQLWSQCHAAGQLGAALRTAFTQRAAALKSAALPTADQRAIAAAATQNANGGGDATD
jgi:hypothetical protein